MYSIVIRPISMRTQAKLCNCKMIFRCNYNTQLIAQMYRPGITNSWTQNSANCSFSMTLYPWMEPGGR